MKSLFLKLTPELGTKLTLAARQNHTTKFEVVRKALETYQRLAEIRTLVEMLGF